MQNKQNLWIGILCGAGLTCLLIYVLSLYQRPDSVEIAPNSPITAKTESVKTPFKPKPKPQKPTAQPQAQISTTPEAIEEIAEIEKINLPGIPENPRLSAQELTKLTPEEREKYERVLKSYRQVRERVLNLHKERQQLQQRMDEIIEEHTTMDQQLNQLRQDKQ